MFFRFALSNIVAPMDFLSQDRPPLELALDISSESRCCLVYYTQYLNTYIAPLPSNFQTSVYWNGIEQSCDGQFIPPDGRRVLKY